MDLNQEILTTLLREEKTHLRRLARLLNKHPTTIRSAINKLEPLLEITKDEKLIIQFTNTPQAKLTKTHLIKLELFNKGLINHINEELHHPTIILFGSAQTGNVNKNSDIDLCIICDEIKEINTKPYEKKIKREIQLFAHTKDTFQKLSEELRNNILNGDILQGYVEIYEI